MVAGKHGAGTDNTFLHESQSLCGFEGRAGRILPAYGAVEQRLSGISLEHFQVFASVAPYEQTRVVGRRRHHAQNLTRLGFYGYYASNFPFHNFFAQGLEVRINAKLQVFPRFGAMIKLPVLITPLETSVNIAKPNLHSLFAAQIFFVGTLNSYLANIISRLIVRIVVNVVLRNLTNIPEYVCAYAISITANAATLNRETAKLKKFLFYLRKLLSRDLAQKKLRSVARISRILLAVFDFEHPFYIEILGDAYCATKIKGVYAVLLVHNYHEIVCRLVVNKKFSLAVGDKSARGVL